jgi:hypothetical protein
MKAYLPFSKILSQSFRSLRVRRTPHLISSIPHSEVWLTKCSLSNAKSKGCRLEVYRLPYMEVPRPSSWKILSRSEARLHKRLLTSHDLDTESFANPSLAVLAVKVTFQTFNSSGKLKCQFKCERLRLLVLYFTRTTHWKHSHCTVGKSRQEVLLVQVFQWNLDQAAILVDFNGLSHCPGSIRMGC